MCGILGFVGSPWRDHWQAALATLRSRGPDGDGVLDLGEAMLAHTRLAVIDIQGGRQPMATPDGRHAITFNGEIYNYRELRAELEKLGYPFITHSDTEVLLHGYVAWGDALLRRLDGMFAFVIWDRHTRTAFAARDRMGIKPLFYSTHRGLTFGSTLAPFFALPGFPRRLNYEGLRDYLAFQTVLAPATILADVKQLPPASWLRYDLASGATSTGRYWDIPGPQEQALPGDFEAQIAAVDSALRTSVRRQLVSDVPLGAFLSGGIDSSLMVHYMAEAGAKPLKTFSVRFADEEFDETPHARAVADKYQTEHHVFEAPAIDGAHFTALIQGLDQPLADPAYIPTAALSELTKRHVTVAISGDGGDELFGGYPRFLETEDRYPDSLLKRSLRQLLAHGLLPGSLLRRTLAGQDMLLYRRIELGPYESSRKSMKSVLAADAGMRCKPGDTLGLWRELATRSGRMDTDGLMRADLWTYLSENCLMKTDRGSMAHGLEVRVPFLGNEVLDTVLAWPARVHFNAAGGKAILRELARRYLPERVWNRPKHGFSVPIRQNLAGAWQEAGDDVFARASELAPFLNARTVGEVWVDAKQGRASRRLAYTFLVLLVWLDAHDVAL
jgi:asparagine synthase (glutamine-hydrolysing)